MGAGPGDEGLLTLRGAQLIGQASLVVAAREPGTRIRQLLAPRRRAHRHRGRRERRARPDRRGQAGHLAVRLYDGDPLLDGGADDALRYAAAGAEFEIVPGVPAATAVPAYAGIPLGGEGGEVRVIHAADASRVAFSPGTLVVLGAEAGPADLGKMLIAAGWPETTPFAVTWDGTTRPSGRSCPRSGALPPT